MNNGQTQRTIFLLASAVDTILSSALLLIYFGLLPIDTSGWGIPRWVFGLVGGIWFMVSLGVLIYLLNKPVAEE